MNLRATRSREDPEINFIPLIDVLLVILIFLMVTTTYQRVSELQITLPEADADAAKQRPKEVNIGIDRDGRYVVDRNVFAFTTPQALADVLKRAAGDAKDPVLIINADGQATHQSVVRVMEAARLAVDLVAALRVEADVDFPRTLLRRVGARLRQRDLQLGDPLVRRRHHQEDQDDEQDVDQRNEVDLRIVLRPVAAQVHLRSLCAKSTSLIACCSISTTSASTLARKWR